jgi:SMC interacting uncharacterized protein involved in chromosome segregation
MKPGAKLTKLQVEKLASEADEIRDRYVAAATANNDRRRLTAERHESCIEVWRQSSPHDEDRQKIYNDLLRTYNVIAKELLDLVTQRNERSKELQLEGSKLSRRDYDSHLKIAEKIQSHMNNGLEEDIPRQIVLIDQLEVAVGDLEKLVKVQTPT